MTAQNVTVTEDALVIDLVDGQTISAPLVWYPRLLHGEPEERDYAAFTDAIRSGRIEAHSG